MIEPTNEFEQQRPRLARLAYRMLGSHADADDILQEAFLRWSRTDREGVNSPEAFLTTVVSRLCIDRRRDIDARKETYIGPWLPEPILESAPSSDSPTERAEAVSLAFLYVMERLTATERAAYLLRQVFNYDYAQIAEVLDKTPANCRQLVSRAQRQIAAGQPRFEPDPSEVARVSQEFLVACSQGNMDGLLQLLSDDVVLVSDGGGKVVAARRPIEGADAVARFFLGVFRKAPANSRLDPVWVNGSPGFAGYVDDQLVSVFSFDIADGRIRGFYVVRNPEKLARAAEQFPQ